MVDQKPFIECPRWHDGRLYFSDFYGTSVYSVEVDGAPREEVRVPGRPAGTGWLPDGQLLAVSQAEKRLYRHGADGPAVHSDMSRVMVGTANDMVVSSRGVAYVGNSGFDISDLSSFAPAPLVRVDASGIATVASEPLFFPNGSALTSDERTLIVAETMGNRLSEFDVDVDGRLGERRDWAVFGPTPATTDVMEIIGRSVVGADGICVDAEGAVWIADCYHQRVIRVAKGGEILDSIDLGDLNAYAIGMGGPSGQTLFICVAPTPFEHLCVEANAAAIWALDVPVPVR
ncbi:SMP-30/gluconolactonase/LRE family protein [Rhodococcus ruber]|uniref:SMP-30/gluconolactonase/LRE family protein n=1 Tax=Rhodococcus ruber TaxID=1830 RepID=A0ABT4MGA7_9NOCA|nr:SMP-30/gluconolactonase/LRE family protein [Rhodococcus ruber]MCZ4519460.1 SMP-30/gluconolactonase/LRE family protein [Rhodococcus ruber]